MLKRKFSFISAALLLVFVDSAGATGPAPSVGQVSVSGNGTNQVTSSSSATSYVQGAGSSISRAANTQSAESYIGGSGSFKQSTGWDTVNVWGSTKPVMVDGPQTTGSVTAYGMTNVSGNSTASNVSTGAGMGAAIATGVSTANVSATTQGTAPGVSLNATGNAFSGVLTRAASGTNASDTSSGATSAGFTATASGSLLKFSSSGITGDIKSVTTNVVTAAGDYGSHATSNALIEAGANANAFADIKATFVKP